MARDDDAVNELREEFVSFRDDMSAIMFGDKNSPGVFHTVKEQLWDEKRGLPARVRALEVIRDHRDWLRTLLIAAAAAIGSGLGTILTILLILKHWPR